jgi:molybdopterin converting factor small subunit
VIWRLKRPVSIKVHIPPALSYLANDQSVADVSGSTVGQCLSHLVKEFPELESTLLGEDGGLNNTLAVFVNLKSCYPEELAKAVHDGDEIHIVETVIGG